MHLPVGDMGGIKGRLVNTGAVEVVGITALFVWLRQMFIV